jgi:hypothetical protein
MKEQDTIDRANEFVCIKEAFYINHLFDLYNEAQRNQDDDSCNAILSAIEKECKRQDPKNKYDEEELKIALIVKRGKHNEGKGTIR